MKKGIIGSLGGVLTAISIIWGLIIIMFYSDSIMSNNHTLYYSLTCLVLFGSGIIMIVKARS